MAQGLKRSGVAVEVFERDASPTSPVEGYRVSISPTGSRALKACLLDAVFDRLTQLASEPSRSVTFFDHRLNRLLALDLPHADRRQLDAERPVGRAILRRQLLDGLDDVVRFGKKFVPSRMPRRTGYRALCRRFDCHRRSPYRRRWREFRGQTSALARRQADRNRDRRGSTAKIPLSEDVRALTPQAIMRGTTLILGPRGRFMFWSAVQLGDLEAGGEARAGSEEDGEQYVTWGFSAPRERFDFPGRLEDLRRRRTEARRRPGSLADWNPNLRRLVQQSDRFHGPVSFSVKTSVPVRPWKTRNVTLLGDALHNMPPYPRRRRQRGALGRGAPARSDRRRRSRRISRSFRRSRVTNGR